MSDVKKNEVFRELKPYDMSRKKLGTAVIFNNEIFEDEGMICNVFTTQHFYNILNC